MKSEKLKRYQVTQSLRFPSNIMKAMFYTAAVLLPAGLIVFIISFFVPALLSVRGLAIVLAVLAIIWLLSAKFYSENNFGLATVSFTNQGIIFRTGGEKGTEHHLAWDDAAAAGMIKTRWAWWCYVSDHELSKKEQKEFPEFVEKGVFYFSYADNTWEEFMKFVPERFKADLEKQKETNIKAK